MDQKRQYGEALSQLQGGNARMAAELCDFGLKRYPGDGNFLVLSAKALIALRDLASAEKRIEEAIRLYPDFAGAHETYGDLLFVQGKGKGAISAYETALRLDPTNVRAHDKIDRARRSASEKTPESAPRNPARAAIDDRIRTAMQFEQNGDLKSAESIYRELLTKDPDNVDAARLLAGIAVHNKRYRDAEVFLKKAVSVAPDYTRAWVDLASVQRELEQFDDAIASAREVLRLAPDNAESHVVYASAVGAAGDHEEAVRAYARALEISPDRPAAACGMAHHQKTLGEQEAAVASYRRAIELKPDHAEAWWSLANLKTFRFREQEVEAMQGLLEQSDLADEARAQLNNALGLEYENRGDYALAFEHFRACNAIRRQHEQYDPMDTEATYDRIIELFTPEFLARHAGAPQQPVTPILIVGLPRSGSTLLEQILASHSQVDGTHELSDLSRSVRASWQKRQPRSRFPDALANFEAGDWQRIGESYLERTEKFRQGASWFIDKNPNNFVYAGLVRLALPNAKIIDARRHPLDSCLGSYKQLFASGQPFTYDATELAEYYLQYRRLMDHWHDVLPGFVLDVEYESVVADLEREVRRMLDFCGLPFEDACLRFHETRRAVKTASSEQVRRPIYSSSVHLWRHYEPYLDEFIDILAPLLDALPAGARPASVPGDS
ncbi:MAG: sulfotransferase [Woeseiaceae bacterium]|nr:sulfotransferase [Woeseiaceae bacterium]